MISKFLLHNYIRLTEVWCCASSVPRLRGALFASSPVATVVLLVQVLPSRGVSSPAGTGRLSCWIEGGPRGCTKSGRSSMTFHGMLTMSQMKLIKGTRRGWRCSHSPLQTRRLTCNPTASNSIQQHPTASNSIQHLIPHGLDHVRSHDGGSLSAKSIQHPHPIFKSSDNLPRRSWVP